MQARAYSGSQRKLLVSLPQLLDRSSLQRELQRGENLSKRTCMVGDCAATLGACSTARSASMMERPRDHTHSIPCARRKLAERWRQDVSE